MSSRPLPAAFIDLRLLLYLIVIFVLAAIALPNFVKARVTRSKNPCEEHAMWIEAAKQLWAAENNKSAADSPVGADLHDYMRRVRAFPESRLAYYPLPFDASGNLTNACPFGGQLSIGAVTQRVSCSKLRWDETHFQERYRKLIAQNTRPRPASANPRQP